MAAPIDGPRLAPKSAAPRQLVVFLHGYGADGNDLIELGRQWRAFLPDALFVAPHAPDLCAMAPSGRQWFSLTQRDPAERWTGVNKARPTLDAFLDLELGKLGLDESALALVGPEHLAEATARGKDGGPPPILLVHGDSDDVIPLDALFDSADALAKGGLPCQWHISFGVGHGIDEGGLMHGGLFIARNFGLRVDAAAPPPAPPRRR